MASWFHWNNLFTSYLPTLKLFTQRETDVARPEMFRSFILPRVRQGQRKCGLWSLCKNQKAGSRFQDKGAISPSVPIFTGQFNERPNTTLSLTRFPHLFFFPSSSAGVIVVTWDKRRACSFGPIHVHLWLPNISLVYMRVCVCVRFRANEHTTGFWRAW